MNMLMYGSLEETKLVHSLRRISYPQFFPLKVISCIVENLQRIGISDIDWIRVRAYD